MRKTVAMVPYTCGELFQGSLDGVPCLVSCPIDRYSKAEIRKIDCLAHTNDLKPKANLAFTLALQTWEIDQPINLVLDSPIPPGRGYGTSTADIGAVLYGINKISGAPLLDARMATTIAIGIEPTDSTYFSQLCLIDHLKGSFFQELGCVPPYLSVLVLDPGGEIDSVTFNCRSWNEILHPLAADHRLAYDMLQEGIKHEDISLISAAATFSARLFQKILFNPLIDYCLSDLKSDKILGLCRAHSGTIVGLLYDNRKTLVEEIIYMIRSIHQKLENVFNVNVVKGGARISVIEEVR